MAGQVREIVLFRPFHWWVSVAGGEGARRARLAVAAAVTGARRRSGCQLETSFTASSDL